MPIFGEKERVAVQFDVDKIENNDLLFGKFCYWVCGVQLGNYDSGVSLSVALSGLTRVVKDNGKRHAGALFDLEVRDLFERLEGGLTGANDRLAAIADEQQWARYDLTNVADGFDGWAVYLLERDGIARFVIRPPSSDELQEFRLAEGDFDRPSLEAFRALEKLWEQAANRS